MKLTIELSEDTRVAITRVGLMKIPDEMIEEVDKAIQNGTPLTERTSEQSDKRTECQADDCIERDYTAKYIEEFANNKYVSEHEAETIYTIAEGIRHIPSVYPKSNKENGDVKDNN